MKIKKLRHSAPQNSSYYKENLNSVVLFYSNVVLSTYNLLYKLLEMYVVQLFLNIPKKILHLHLGHLL